MQLGMIGLGRMGARMARRLADGGHSIAGFDPDPQAAGDFSGRGFGTVSSLDALIERLAEPRIVWLMVPAGAAVDDTIEAVAPRLGPDGILIDGGNSNYKDSLRRHATLRERGVAFLDVGTSGGLWGGTDGYGLTIGGDAATVARVGPVFETLAPAADRGWAHVGPAGAGHFVKMVHNAIEYGMMQAYAEGFAILERREDFELDLAAIARTWNEGSVIRSWLLDLAANALSADPKLSAVSTRVGDSGEGRWALAEAVDLDVATPVLALSLIVRLQSRDPKSFSNRLLNALRREFGGHQAPAEH